MAKDHACSPHLVLKSSQESKAGLILPLFRKLPGDWLAAILQYRCGILPMDIANHKVGQTLVASNMN